MEALQKHVTLSVYFLYFGLDKSRSLLLCPLVWQLSLNYMVDTGFLYNKGAMIRDKIKSRAGCFGLSQCPGINPEFRWVKRMQNVSNKSTDQMQQFLRFITRCLLVFRGQHVSGVLTPIIRSSTTAVASLIFLTLNLQNNISYDNR